MDVINLSIGEPEIPPSRDLVVRAIEGAAAAGVVSTVSAGNDFDAFGRGSVSSPGSAASAITVAATTVNRQLAGFSSAGPTPLSLRLKPEVSAPGVEILSAAPNRRGQWQSLSGTSMAAPHVAGAAAVLLQRHPTWTPAQVKSALVTTGQQARETRGMTPRPRARAADSSTSPAPTGRWLFASPVDALVRIPQARPPGGEARGAHGCRGRRRRVGRLARPPEAHGRPGLGSVERLRARHAHDPLDRVADRPRRGGQRVRRAHPRGRDAPRSPSGQE